MKSLLLSAALAAMTFAAPAMAQDNASPAPAPNVNVNVDAPAAPAAPVVESHNSTVEKTTVVDRQPAAPTGTDNTTLGVVIGLGVLGAAAVIGLAASNRG
jgi:hypothetical protein